MASNVFQNVHPHFNPEEAAYAAAEFVGSLDNLPGEVTFLLEEISEKDRKINNLLARINTRHYGLTKNIKSVTTSQPPTAPGTPTFVLPIPAGADLPLGHLNAKEQQAMSKILAEWTKVEQIQQEKIKLAMRLEQITSRARERGRSEWKKVGGMDLDEIEKSEGPRNGFGEMGGAEVLLPPGGLGSGSDGRPMKKRKPSALPLPLPNHSTPIMHPPPASMLPPPAPRPSLSARQTNSRHGRNISTSTLSEDPDADGEMDAAEAEGEGEADDTLYCFCQQKSYGEMIGCDNGECEYEWFHVKCVNMSGELPETWYCPACVTKLGFASSDGSRAGQKKASSRRR